MPRRALVDLRVWRSLAVVPLRHYVLQRWMGDWSPDSGALTAAQAQRFLGIQSNIGFSRNSIARL